MIKMVVFLGNPGLPYRGTRHNMARLIRAALPGDENLAWREKFKGRLALWDKGPQGIWFLEPLTFMNLSGISVSMAGAFYKLKPEKILVVHDDLELPLGLAAWRRGGGLGGHKGLKSIARQTGSQEFLRFRGGIGRPSRGSVESWVLGRFSPEEEIILPLITEKAARVLEDLLTGKHPFPRAQEQQNFLPSGVKR